MKRSDFLKYGISGACILAIKTPLNICASSLSFGFRQSECEAMYYRRTPRGIRCELCPNECNISETKPGTCQTRFIRNDKLICTAYGNPYYINIEGPETQSLFHFLPGSKNLSIGTAGCNLSCQYCMISGISQKSPSEVPSQELFPDQAINYCLKKSAKAIIYSFTEPTVYFEYMLETAKLAKRKGIKNVMVSNGNINEKPLREIAQYLDAAVIHVKAFSDATYQKLTGGSIFPVFKTIQTLKEQNVWLEINHLMVPGWTDNFDLLKKMTDWMVSSGFKETPFHITRFQPSFRLSQVKATPTETLLNAQQTALNSGLTYVYSEGTGELGQTTLCPKCHSKLVERKNSKIITNYMKYGKCHSCNEVIKGLW